MVSSLVYRTGAGLVHRAGAGALAAGHFILLQLYPRISV